MGKLAFKFIKMAISSGWAYAIGIFAASFGGAIYDILCYINKSVALRRALKVNNVSVESTEEYIEINDGNNIYRFKKS